MKTTTLLLFLALLWAETVFAQQKQAIELFPAKLLQEHPTDLTINGAPQLIDSPYGKALYFDGLDDALLLDRLPLNGLSSFTVELIFAPDTASPFEQRMLHIGEDRGDRMLLELRAVDGHWYFDGYAASKTNKKALIDETLTHPLGQWYHVAFTVEADRLTTFVNGKQELTEAFSFLPILSGGTSIGTRIDKRSWFKGSIYQIKISPRILKPTEFMAF